MDDPSAELPERRTLADIFRAEPELAGYHEGPPPWVSIAGATTVERLARRLSCAHCGHYGLDPRLFHDPASQLQRTFGCCPTCGQVVEL